MNLKMLLDHFANFYELEKKPKYKELSQSGIVYVRYVTNHAVITVYTNGYVTYEESNGNRLRKSVWFIKKTKWLYYDEKTRKYVDYISQFYSYSADIALGAYGFKRLQNNSYSNEQHHFDRFAEIDEIFDSDFVLEMIRAESQKEISERLTSAWSKLTSKQAEVLYKRFYQNMSFVDIANSMGISNTTVHNHYTCAIKKLRKELGAL